MELLTHEFIFISIAFIVVAIMYSSVGHAGASGYTAVLTLFGVAPLFVRPTSLILNVAVGAFGFYKFYKANLIDVKKVGPFLLGSMPLSYVFASLPIDKTIFYAVLGIILFLSGAKMLFEKVDKGYQFSKTISYNFPLAIVIGAVIGMMAGITGTGGAIFFTPLILALGWAQPREASGLSILFVLANSLFGLAGTWKTVLNLEVQHLLVWVLVVLLGAGFGTSLGINKFSNHTLKRILGGVLLLASLKLLT